MTRTFIRLLFATLWITLTEAGEAPVILSYWDPEPKSEFRRKGTKESYYFHPIKYVTKKKPLQRGKRIEPNVKWSSSEDNKKSIYRTHKSEGYYNNGSFGSNIRMRIERSGRDGEGEKRSTRIAPLQLMQQEGEKPENKQTDKSAVKPETQQEKKENKPDESDALIGNLLPINPYSIQKQFQRLLGAFNDSAEYTTEVVGRTVSYLDIVLFKLTQSSTKCFRADDNKYVEHDTQDKKIIFIVHALSPMGLGNLFSLTLESHLKMLLSYYISHLDKFDIYLIPLANPDGYLRVKSAVYWNKNVSPNAACPGVDIDRNFDVAWNSTSTNMSSCSQHFPGLAPFSEPESRAVRDIFHRVSHKIVAYIHVHGGTYTKNTFKGDAVLYPKGYSDHSSDDDKYIDLRGEIDEAIKNANFKVLSVTVSSLYDWYGKVAGSSVDYASSIYGIPYAMEFVMQLYQDAFETQYKKVVNVGSFNLTSMEYYSLDEIWRRVINTTFTTIHKKLIAHDAENNKK